MTGPQESEGLKERLREGHHLIVSQGCRASPSSSPCSIPLIGNGHSRLVLLPSPSGLSLAALQSYQLPSTGELTLPGTTWPSVFCYTTLRRQAHALFLHTTKTHFPQKPRELPVFFSSLLPQKLTSENFACPHLGSVQKFLGSFVRHAHRYTSHEGVTLNSSFQVQLRPEIATPD